MSASRERKNRTGQEFQSAPAQQKTKKKLSDGWIFAICIVTVFALVVGGIAVWRSVARNRTVMTVGEKEISVKEFNYFYYSAANTLSSYASYMGIDTAKPLDEQNVTVSAASFAQLIGLDTEYLADKTPNETEYDVTWAQLLAYNARKTAAQAYSIAQAAQQAGYQLDADEYEAMDAEIESIQTYADQNYETVDELIERVYGDGCNEENYRAYLELMHIAEHYPATLEYSDEEIAAYYAEHAQEVDVVTYYAYRVSASDFTQAAEDGTTPEATDEDRAAAQAAAEAMVDSFDPEDEKVSILADQNLATVTSSTSEEFATWLFTEADTETARMYHADDSDSYTVVKLIAKDDYASMRALQIYISTANAANVELVDAALAEDASEETFHTLAEQYSEDGSEGHIEGATRGNLYSTSEELFLWSMEARTAGDYTKVTVEDGTIYLFYLGEGETYNHLVVNNALISEWLDTITQAALESCGYSEKAAMGGKVDLTFSNE